jgi:hypothetical protein
MDCYIIIFYKEKGTGFSPIRFAFTPNEKQGVGLLQTSSLAFSADEFAKAHGLKRSLRPLIGPQQLSCANVFYLKAPAVLKHLPFLRSQLPCISIQAKKKLCGTPFPKQCHFLPPEKKKIFFNFVSNICPQMELMRV